MAEDCPKPDRPWRVIAQEVSTERDSDRVAELSEELIKALDRSAGARNDLTQRCRG